MQCPSLPNSFSPQAFLIVSDPVIARFILREEAYSFDKGVLAEILEAIMGKGLIPADLETWQAREGRAVEDDGNGITSIIRVASCMSCSICRSSGST